MTDFSTFQPGLESPPSRAYAITPDNNTDLAVPIRGLMVAVAGNVALTTLGGDDVVLPALQPGIQYAILARRVFATGTTATGLVGLS